MKAVPPECEARTAAGHLQAFAYREERMPAPTLRTATPLAAIEQRNDLLRVAAARFLPGLCVQAAARDLHRELRRYATTAWPRERLLDALPQKHRGTMREALWRALKARDHIPSESHLRRILRADVAPS
jgi:hypothetical protein